MNNPDGSEFIGGYLHNQTQAQPLDVFDQILQEVERTQVKASQTMLIISGPSVLLIEPKQIEILRTHFGRIYRSPKWHSQGFILRPARWQ